MFPRIQDGIPRVQQQVPVLLDERTWREADYDIGLDEELTQEPLRLIVHLVLYVILGAIHPQQIQRLFQTALRAGDGEVVTIEVSPEGWHSVKG